MTSTITLDEITAELRRVAPVPNAWVGGIGGNVMAVHVGRRTITLNGGQPVAETPATLEVWYHAARAGESDMPTERTEVSSPDEVVQFLAALPLSREEQAERDHAELWRTETPIERAILTNFLIAALWADARDDNGEEVDTGDFDADDVQADEATWVKVKTMVRAFITELDISGSHCLTCWPLPRTGGTQPREADCECGIRRQALRLVTENPEQAGHDLWLTMRHHGVGFWDRGYGPAGDLLTELADRLGTEDASIYVTVESDGTRVARLDYPA
jgi:hypothetical protein